MSSTLTMQLIDGLVSDMTSFADFMYKPADFMVTRRLAPPTNTLQFYIDRFDATKATTDAYVATIPGIVNDAINNTAVEGGVLADTFITVTANGVGTVARTQRDKNSESLSIKDFGAVGDGVIPNEAPAIQAAIDYMHSKGGGIVRVGAGHYLVTEQIILKDGVYLKGDGSKLVKLDQGTKTFSMISTPTKTEKPLTLTNSLLTGATTNLIANTCKAGDLIRYKSARLWTDRWADRVIRAYYYEAEMLEIKSATPTSVSFHKPAFINCMVDETPDIVYFTPNKNIGISGMTLTKSAAVVNYSNGLNMYQVEGGYIDDVFTENYDSAGISITKCIRMNTGVTSHIGGSDTLGLCYGVTYSDGTRDCYQESINGSGCRHVVAGGGSGWGIPLYVTVNSITASNSKSGALDAHAGTGFFTYNTSNVDIAGGMSGVGHVIKSLTAIGPLETAAGNSFGCHEGGIDLKFSNVTCVNHGRFAANECVVNSTFDTIDINSPKFNVVGFRAGGSKGNKFYNLELNCTGVTDTSTTAEADACHTIASANGIGSLATTDSIVDGLVIRGFPYGVLMGFARQRWSNITVYNCGWQTALSPTNAGTLVVTNGNNSSLREVEVINTNTVLKWTSRFLRIAPNTPAKRFSLVNVNNELTPLDARNYYGYNVTANISELFIQNVNIKAKGTAGTFAATSGKYIYTNMAADN